MLKSLFGFRKKKKKEIKVMKIDDIYNNVINYNIDNYFRKNKFNNLDDIIKIHNTYIYLNKIIFGIQYPLIIRKLGILEDASINIDIRNLYVFYVNFNNNITNFIEFDDNNKNQDYYYYNYYKYYEKTTGKIKRNYLNEPKCGYDIIENKKIIELNSKFEYFFILTINKKKYLIIIKKLSRDLNDLIKLCFCLIEKSIYNYIHTNNMKNLLTILNNDIETYHYFKLFISKLLYYGLYINYGINLSLTFNIDDYRVWC